MALETGSSLGCHQKRIAKKPAPATKNFGAEMRTAASQDAMVQVIMVSGE
jgi:hypothetical protein